MHDFLRIERRLHVDDGLFCRFKDGIEPPKHSHRENYIPIFSPDVEVAEYIVSNPPDEACYPT